MSATETTSPSKKSKKFHVYRTNPIKKPSSRVPGNAQEASSNWSLLQKANPWLSSTKKYEKKPEPEMKKARFQPPRLTNAIAIDCEMVGIGPRNESTLARVSLVNEDCECLLDKYVKPKVDVTDYRTFVSGIREKDLINASDYDQVMKEVDAILHGKIIVGHAIKNDFKVLGLTYPRHLVRDTSKYFKKRNGGGYPSLRKLAQTELNLTIQTGEHDSVEDARTTMKIFLKYRSEWDEYIRTKTFPNKMEQSASIIKKSKTRDTTDSHESS